MAINNEKLNEMTIQEAALLYSIIGIVTHPLNGKKSKLLDWQRLTKTPFDKFKPNDNLGAVCGIVSDLTVVDVDRYVKGIWDNILYNVDISEFVKQAHCEEKWHWLFRYCNELKAGKYQPLGFDILSDSQIYKKSTNEHYTASNSCVVAPSVHADGNKYQIFGSIENRPEVPEIIVKLINDLLLVYEDLTKKVIPKCRNAFKKLWSAVFIEKKNKLYHDFSIFAERNRLLHFMVELKANGASDVQLNLVCMLIFGNDYDALKSEEEIKQIDSRKTATNESIVADPILSQFHTEKDKVVKDKTIEDVEDEIDPLDIDLDEQGISSEMLEAAEREADEILKNGDPLTYVLDTIARVHTGDNNAEEAISVSFGGQSCSNTGGMQTSLCGPSSSGKSHTVKSNLHLVPRRFKRVGSLSGKAAYYHKLRPGMIVYSDDTRLSTDMEDTIKRATTNYQEYTLHFTVADQKKVELFIPPRINWLFTNVDPEASEQILNRQVVYETSSDIEQKRAIFEHQGDEAVTGETILDVDLRVLICRRIYARIKELEPVKVVIPFAKRIKLSDINNSRIFTLLLDMIRGYAIFKYQQREKDSKGNLIATEEDFWRAKRLFESRAENTVTHLTENEKAVVEFIIMHQGDIGCTINEIASGVTLSSEKKLSYKQVSELIKGKLDKKETGLLYKIKGMRKEIRGNQLGGRPSDYYKIENYDVWKYGDDFVSLVAECTC